MAYPHLENKHAEEALFHPEDFIKHSNIQGIFPSKYIITYQRKTLAYFIRTYKPRKVKINSQITLYIHKGIGCIKMAGIGSPHAVTVMEELIALGGKEFINIGTCGGLQALGTYLCTEALRDEGTSYHYLPHGQRVFPDARLTERLRSTLTNEKIDFKEGTTWTIDAPYRETKKEVAYYKNQGVVSVEMEASALFALAQYRNVSIASAFVVSDVLGIKWEPHFKAFNVVKAQKQLVDAAIRCLLQR